MAHDLGSAKAARIEVDDRFDDDTPTREYYLKGLETKVDTLGTALHEERLERRKQADAQRLELHVIAAEAKATREAVGELADEVRKLLKFVLEERGERLALNDRVSAVEQRPSRAKRK